MGTNIFLCFFFMFNFGGRKKKYYEEHYFIFFYVGSLLIIFMKISHILSHNVYFKNSKIIVKCIIDKYIDIHINSFILYLNIKLTDITMYHKLIIKSVDQIRTNTKIYIF